MIKRTLYFSNPAYLNFKDEQLLIQKRIIDTSLSNEKETDEKIYDDKYLKRKTQNESIPVEDIGIVIIDHYGVSASQYLISKLLENNVAVIFCNDKHHPTGLLLNLDGNSIQSEKFKAQINSSLPLRKNLWQQTVSTKIRNQSALLKSFGVNVTNMESWAEKVNSGDTKNLEARASVYYWKNLFPKEIGFYRDRFGEPPNNLLNYGYAVLRAVVARGLVSSGLLPTLGIHHRNKYNAYCLADDIMEPYRPYVDKIVCSLTNKESDIYELTAEIKRELLLLPASEIIINNKRSPLMVGLQQTTSSLAKCFEGKLKKISYPDFKAE